MARARSSARLVVSVAFESVTPAELAERSPACYPRSRRHLPGSTLSSPRRGRQVTSDVERVTGRPPRSFDSRRRCVWSAG